MTPSTPKPRSASAPARGWGADFCVASTLAAAAFGLVLANGGIWGHVGGFDLHGAFLPKYLESARALFREGRLPLWNPYEFCGTPMFATIQGLTLYLPVPLLFAALPPYWALQGLYAVNLLVLAWGTVAYLRKHGVGRPAAALAFFASLAGLFSSYAMVGLDHPNFLASIAWLPWILLCLEHALERGPRPWLGLFALMVGMQWLAGYPDFPMDTAILVGVVALVSDGGTWPRRCIIAVAGVGLGTALVAVQLFPLAEAVAESYRAAAPERWVESRNMFALYSMGLLVPVVWKRLGVGGVVLALLAFQRFSRARLAWLLAFLWAVFALEPPLRWVYLLPGYSGARYPLGWSHLFPVFFGFLVAAAAWSTWERGGRVWRTIAVVLSIAALAPWVQKVYESPARLETRGLPDYELLARRTPLLAAAQRSLPGRPRVLAAFEMDAGMMPRERIASAAGYDPTMPPYRVRRLLDHVNGFPWDFTRAVLPLRNPELSSLLGVGLVAVGRVKAPHYRKAGYRTVGRLPPDHVLLYRPSVPHVRIVHRADLARDDDAAYERIVEPGRDLRETTVVVVPTGTLPPLVSPPAGATERVEVVVDEPERVEVAARLAAPGLVVLTDTHYPGWYATVDGEAVDILQADYAFRAVAVPAGDHRIVFSYAPMSLRLGAAVSALAVLLTVFLVLPRGMLVPRSRTAAR